jgi:hypothetical protein
MEFIINLKERRIEEEKIWERRINFLLKTVRSSDIMNDRKK